MSAPVVIPREQALANARRALDAARAENAADYRSGRMSPERRAIYERLLAVQAQRDAAASSAAA